MPEAIVLRDYQAEAIERLRQGLRDGHRSQLLYLATGGGKSVVAAQLMAEAARKGTQACFLVDRTVLVDQFSAHLDRFGVDHGVIMAGHWRRRPDATIQVASAQTIERRDFFPKVQLLIVDECHAVRKATADLIKNREDIKVLGLTATPFTKGLGDLYSNIVTVRTTNELIGEGSLVPLKLFAAVSPDMEGAKVVAGEWSERDIEQRGMTIVGDVVQEWIRQTGAHFGGPAKTFVFSATVEHGWQLCREFNAAGYRFEQISYRDTDSEQRAKLMEEFRRPDSSIVGLVSCEALARGTDVPDVLVGVDCRPYRKSLSGFIQKIGRVMRPAQGKSYALWLDHAGNCLRFYKDMQDLFENGVTELTNELDTKVRKEPEQREREEIKCGACSFVMGPSVRVCPACGHERPRRALVETVPGTMVLIGGKPVAATGKYAFLEDRYSVWRQLAGLALERKQGDVELAQRFAQAQYRNLYGEFARARVDRVEAEPPSPELRSYVTSQMIRWARSQARRAA